MPRLSHSPLDLEALVEAIAQPSQGAVATFAGLVRDHHAGRAVTRLAYSAYEPMAEAACEAIIAEAQQRFGVRADLRHRLGDVPIGEAAVVIVAAAAHRAEAFDAVRWMIDEVKSRVPIWKRERYADGTEAWVDPTVPDGIVAARQSP
ncbi:MAG: molybdenum cofactor biosynthesis protein MoaE [Gemmatimonadota bacterium]